MQTWFVPAHAPQCYRVELAAGPASSPLVFVTADPAVYADALDAEGHLVHVVAQWHADGRLRVLDHLDPAPHAVGGAV